MNFYDETGRYQQVNPYTTDFLERPASAIEGRRLDEIHPPETVAIYMERIAQVVATQQPMVVEDRVTQGDAERILQTVLFPVLSPPDEPQLLGLVATDITDVVTAREHLKRQAEQERLLRDITGNIRRSLDLDTVLNSTVVGIREFLATDRALIYQFNADWSGSIRVESVIEPWISVLGETLPDLRFIARYVGHYSQGHMTQITDIESADISSAYRDLLKSYQVRANLVLPLVIDHRLWGLLCMHHCRAPRCWQSDEITFVEQIADQVEIAIQQALLLHQTRIRAQREQVLNEIVTDIRNSLDLEEIMTRTTQKLLIEFQVGRCVVIRCADEDEYFEYQACAATPEMADLTGHRLPLQDNSYVLSILAQEIPRATADVTNEAQLASFQPLVQSLNIGSLLSVAIRHEGIVRGILCVHHATPRSWTTPEQILIKQVADQLAIAIQQAELYQQAQAEILQRQRLENQLRHDALHDSLTGLPNRTLFLERLQLALQRYQRRLYAPSELASEPPLTEFAVLFLDLDRFKVINDSLGHTVGDQLLKLVADRLKKCLRDIDIAARLGGDEFAILLEDLGDPQFAADVAQRIHNILALPILLGDREVFIRASIGIILSSHHHTVPEQIVQNADIAMYEAKKKGCEFVIFDASMHAIALEKMNLEYDLQHAIKRAEFRLYFQPIVALVTSKIIGFEALVRWQHPTRGLLFPEAFIETAEDTGLIAALDLWVLNRACEQLSHWHQMGTEFSHLTVSVNLSGRQFSQPDLIQQIDQALASANLGGQYLKLEITESVLITNSTLTVQILQELRVRNIQVCMDGFGTGYSSLSYLHQFPVNVLKIDKSFILTLNSPKADSRDYEIVKAIIHLALNLHLEVVAEGIEHPDVWAYLQKNECQFGQGYHFAPALAATAATDLLLDPTF
ncbi:MAG: EAL domain-containing protein [Leptolyngbya sp. SIOISBB]|nr:EAL domain-containing protein [Leptolyngbya sp. SIOISBB]